MKLLFLNRSDSYGGAAVASVRLMEALQEQGVDVRMLVMEKQTNNPAIYRATKHRWQSFFPFLAERMEIFTRNGFDRKQLFKVSTSSYGVPIARHPLVAEADIIHLHWINQGFLSMASLKSLAELPKPLFWSMHDFWPATGICHLPQSCQSFETGCHHCPQINSTRALDLSKRLSQEKRELNRHPIHYLAVSQWQASLASRSALIGHQPIEVLHNPIDLQQFSPRALPADLRAVFDGVAIPILMVAARLDDPVKGLDLCIEFLCKAKSLFPDLMSQSKLILVGDLRDRTILDQIPIAVQQLPMISEPERLASLYSASRLLICSSRVETFGQTLSEANACGTPFLSFDSGGQADIALPGVNAYLAKPFDTDEMARLLPAALELSASSDARLCCRDSAQRFESSRIAKILIGYYRQALLSS